ncbi:site-specific integrase [Chroococcus sp. FPU101]|uniref:tyrosine-type recombinase/integrase n=1 Tax=Chroococcus sp. FPU101 TaxID=1974212 RepID=UPI001A8C1708|nr:site-specific integrase [Chroococcus sp. FPU101]GFE72055.1 phage integrase family protein [Chroococcus sp. FPU101]
MKIDRHGQAKILTTDEIQRLFNQGLTVNPPRDRALFAVCLYTACRISEAVTLTKRDVYDTQGNVRPELIIRKGNTKGKLATRTIPVIEDLRIKLEAYTPRKNSIYLFPGNEGNKRANTHLHRDSAIWLLNQACKRVGIEGVSTHSFRRTALTQMSNAGIPLRIIQEISGHRTLDELYKYLEVKPEQIKGAIASLSLLTPVEGTDFDKTAYHEVSSDALSSMTRKEPLTSPHEKDSIS